MWTKYGCKERGDLYYALFQGLHPREVARITPYNGRFYLNIPLDADREYAIECRSLKEAKSVGEEQLALIAS